MVIKEYISPEGFRQDGRRVNEIRTVNSKIGGISKTADGSASFEIGNTKVMAVVFGPWEGFNKKGKNASSGVNCKYSFSSFATQERRKRFGNERQFVSYSLAIKQTFDSIIVYDTFQKSQIDIYITILESDGSELAASINAVSLALMDAGIPLRDIPSACTASVIGRNVLADISYSEQPACSASLTLVVLSSNGKVLLTELDSKLEDSLFYPLWETANNGACAIGHYIKRMVIQRG